MSFVRWATGADEPLGAGWHILGWLVLLVMAGVLYARSRPRG